MALRNQPYFPLYVQDYLTDEKLSLCKWESQGIYIKILCILHKQQTYGRILFNDLFKQTSKQNLSSIKYFASVLVKLIPCQIADMENALEDLVFNEVLKIDDDGIYQSRMVKDFHKSEERSKAGKKGGGNPILFKQKDKQEFKQEDKQVIKLNTENENENRIDNTNLIYKTENLSILKEIGGVGERENFKDSQNAVSQNAVSQNCLPKESDSEPPLQNTAGSEPNQLPLEEKKEEKEDAYLAHVGNLADGGDDEPKTPNTDSTPKTSRRLNDNLPSGIPLYLEDFEAYKTHLREFYVSFVNGEPKTIKFIDEMCNRYPNLDFQKTLTMNLVDYWATEEGYKTKLKAAKLAVKTNKGKDYHIDWFKTLATSFKYPTNRLYKQKDKPTKQEVSTSLPYGYIDLNAPVVRKG